ncbi:AAA family ATPase [Campylobacter corcagiensis]|uniref:AAA family ATPase n=1 Tax=Campylobacter corcagiensis TaxID=1448857 RepID=A0A7M1LFB4_9BACT|nr:AAA family ATPase [Campylobacter corcagiensis]QKF64579.1 bacteriophage DNA transposition protein B [Campylobacter corcagiensis]QOQ87248.1 AAA family ATPase [Campylobacter corcagiensis]
MNLQERIAEFLLSKGVSQNQFAKTVGINPAYLTGYMKEGKDFKYANKVEDLAKNYLDNFIQSKPKNQDDLPFITTKDAKSINAVIEWSVEDRDLGVIIGDAGTGKSRAIKEFSKSHPEAVLIEATISTNARALFRMLCLKFGITTSKSVDEMIRDVADSLKKIDKVIIIDEAEHLPYRALEALRRMYDFSKSPVVLVGTKKLLNNLTGAKKSNLEYEQLSSRVGSKWFLEGLTYLNGDKAKVNKDLVEVCKLFGVENNELINQIERLTRGNFRKTEKLLKRAKRVADLNEMGIDGECINEATKMLLL